MPTKAIEKYFFFGLLFITLLFTFFIFRPFWIVIVLGMSFSIVLYPVYKVLNKKLSSPIASLLTVIFFIFLVYGPLLGIGFIIFNQSQDLYGTVVSSGEIGPFLETLNTKINQLLPPGVDFDMQAKISEVIAYARDNITAIFSATASAFFSFILMLLIMFYFLKDGEKWKKEIIILSPLGDKDDEKIIVRLINSVNAVIKGSLFIALVQGLVMGIGLFIFNVPNAALWGVIASIASLVPTIGTALVSVPAIIFLLAIGESTNAIGLAIWAGIAVGMVDNFLSPIIVGKKIDIPPFFILFSVLGGITLLGPIGILVGPLTVSLLYTLISIYVDEFTQHSIL